MENVNSADTGLPECGNKLKNKKLKVKTKTQNLKRFWFYSVQIFIFYFLVFSFKLFCYAEDIKQPNVAGGFYPDNPKQLSEMIDDFLQKANPPSVNGEIFALISPHAGYGFSGQAAAYGYKSIKGKPYKTVIILGPSHYRGYSGIFVYPGDAFRTPLGDVPVDKEFTNLLLSRHEDADFNKETFEREHSIEVQIPFLQKSLTDFKIVPILVGDCTLSTCKNIAKKLQAAIGDRNDVLVVASTDMYHGYDYDELKKTDAQTIEILKGMDPEGLYYALRERRAQLCGGVAVVITMFLSKDMGHNELFVLNYTNSPEVTGNKAAQDWKVGYVSCAIDEVKGDKMILSKEERKILLNIARNSIETYLKTGKKLEVSESDPVLAKKMGAFVTLSEHGNLRGCIGNLTGIEPLYLTVRDMAVEAAVGDPRFPQVKLGELKDIEIEISALSPLERVKNSDDIQLGKHGVIVKRGFNSGVYLPQVATETGWSKEEFLSSLCAHKAGLPADAWKDKDTELYIFTAEVFSEKESGS